MKTDKLIQLIICNDRRATELAKILKDAGQVYRRNLEDGVWVYWLFEDEAWNPIEESIPEKFDLLFFHTGQNDPDGIPDDRTFVKRFAFSTGGVSEIEANSYKEEEVIPIQRHFPTGGCPIKERHISELRDFVEGSRSDLPSFCRHDENVPILSALAILCQGYAAAGIASGEIPLDSPLITHLEWNKVSPNTTSRLSKRLGDLWSRMQPIDWWRDSLGINNEDKKGLDSTKYKTFLLRLIQDLELDVLAKTKLNLNSEEDLCKQSEDSLLMFLRGQPKASKILSLFDGTELNPDTVENAYKEIKHFLEQ